MLLAIAQSHLVPVFGSLHSVLHDSTHVVHFDSQGDVWSAEKDRLLL